MNIIYILKKDVMKLVGTVAQIIAITAYGNAALKGFPIKDFLLENSTSTFCNSIKFIEFKKTGIIEKLLRKKEEHFENIIASDFNSWVDFLKKEKVQKLYLHYISSNNKDISDRMSAGFIGGGGRWLIEAFKGKHSDYWEASWEVTDENNKDNKIWAVNYIRISNNDIVRKDLSIGIDNFDIKLKDSLIECQNFAEKQNLDGFKSCFEKAILCLNNDDTSLSTIYHQDLVPRDFYDTIHRNILFACQSAWVFGGMGSWNDMWFEKEDQNIYDNISNELFYAICNSIARVTNEFKH